MASGWKQRHMLLGREVGGATGLIHCRLHTRVTWRNGSAWPSTAPAAPMHSGWCLPARPSASSQPSSQPARQASSLTHGLRRLAFLLPLRHLALLGLSVHGAQHVEDDGGGAEHVGHRLAQRPPAPSKRRQARAGTRFSRGFDTGLHSMCCRIQSCRRAAQKNTGRAPAADVRLSRLRAPWVLTSQRLADPQLLPPAHLCPARTASAVAGQGGAARAEWGGHACDPFRAAGAEKVTKPPPCHLACPPNLHHHAAQQPSFFFPT